MLLHNFKYSFKTLFKNKMLIFWTFAFPIILGTFFNIFITYDINKTLSFYVNGNLIGTITNAVTSQAQPYLFNGNVVYNKLIAINSCLPADEITILNNEVK